MKEQVKQKKKEKKAFDYKFKNKPNDVATMAIRFAKEHISNGGLDVRDI